MFKTFITCIARRHMHWIGLAAILLIASCQKETGTIPNQNNPVASHDGQNISVESFLLEYNFGLQTSEMSEEMIVKLYDEYMQNIAPEDRKELEDLAQFALAQEYPVTKSGNAGGTYSTTMLSTGLPDDGYGYGVATSGNKVFVGAKDDQIVYEYNKEGGTYLQAGMISPGEVALDFGRSISVSGAWMAVSSPEFGLPYPSGEGRVFMFKNEGDGWVLKDVLYGPVGNLSFGGDGLVLQGNTLAVTSRNLGFPIQGTISVFNLQGDIWNLTNEIFLPGYAFFALDMNKAANTIVSTGPFNNSLGTVRALVFSKSGQDWVFEEEVIVPSPVPFAIAFPRDVAIHNNTIVLTAIFPGYKHWVINKTAGNWQVTQELVSPGGGISNRWAEIQGSTLVIAEAGGKTHVYNKSGMGWMLTESLMPSYPISNGAMWGFDLHDNTIVTGIPGFAGTPGSVFIYE